MHTRTPEVRRTPRRASGDSGAALVEFALVSVPLILLVFGIIYFGLLLSFKQDMTRAAAEGARAGAVAVPVGVNPTPADYVAAALDAARDATREAVEGIGGSFDTSGCLRAGMDCTDITVGACDEDPSVDCVTVHLSYDYDREPLIDVPLFSDLVNEVNATSVARING